MLLAWVSFKVANKMLDGGFPGGPVVEDLPCSARDNGVIPDPRKIPHALGQLS